MINKAFSRGLLVLVAAFATHGALAQTREASSSGELLDRVAATVNDGVVLSSELDNLGRSRVYEEAVRAASEIAA